MKIAVRITRDTVLERKNVYEGEEHTVELEEARAILRLKKAVLVNAADAKTVYGRGILTTEAGHGGAVVGTPVVAGSRRGARGKD